MSDPKKIKNWEIKGPSKGFTEECWLVALTAALRRLGEYWRSLETKSTASGGMRLWKICEYMMKSKMSHYIKKLNMLILCIMLYRKLYLVPWMSFNLREFEFRVIRVHALDFFPSRRSQNLHNAKQTLYQNYPKQEHVIKANKCKAYTLIISTSWSTPLSPGNKGCNEQTIEFVNHKFLV